MEVTFTLIEKRGLQSFYKSSSKLTRGLDRLMSTPTVWDLKDVTKRVKSEYLELFPSDGFEVICISNAHTHSEKLAFAGIYYHDGSPGRTQMQIEGIHTMSIYGGDISACWEDEKYLRLIARHNGYSQNKVTIIS